MLVHMEGSGRGQESRSALRLVLLILCPINIRDYTSYTEKGLYVLIPKRFLH